MKLLQKTYLHVFVALMSALALGSCSMMTEDEPDCNPYYKVRFRFDMNMLYADAFPTQIGEVDLYLFDEDGKLVWQGHEEGDTLARDGYMMDLPVAPGKYDMIAWCRKRHENASDFKLAGGAIPAIYDDLCMTLERNRDEVSAYSDTDLHALFHGKLSKVELPDTWGTHIVTMPLIKDTNSIRIMLVHLSGKEIKADDFDFKISDSNGRLSHDNTLLEDEIIEYRTWSKREGLAQAVMPSDDESTSNKIVKLSDTRAPITSVHSLVAELTTSRLQTCRRPILTVTRTSDGEKVIEIPLIDYFMMVKGEYNRHMEDDEYLDRQDDYNMTFFMHEDGSWFKAVVDILSWRVVLQSADL